MELFLLDKNFQICGLIDDFSSLLWNRKYYEYGDFNLQIGLKYIEQFKNAEYVYSKEFVETGILEAFNYVTTTNGTDIQFSGKFLESILGDRVIDKTQYFRNKTTEEIVRSLVTTYFINAGERHKEGIVLGEYKGLGKIRTMQMTGDNVLEKIYELCKEDELSIKLWYDFDNNQMVFEVWQGLDRVDTQNTNSWVIFSRNFENILEDNYCIDNRNYRNFAYVKGEIEVKSAPDEDGNVTITKKRIERTINRIKEGEERKELYVDARDLQSDDNTTASEYEKMLLERGNEKLNECNKIETSNFKIDSLSNLEYKKDFNLGDRGVYKNEDLGLIIENRIVGITESYENGDKTIDVTFGEDYNIKKVKELIQK